MRRTPFFSSRVRVRGVEVQGRTGEWRHGGRRGGWPKNGGAVAAATGGVGEPGGVGFRMRPSWRAPQGQ